MKSFLFLNCCMFALFIPTLSQAEPWLSNKYSTNCAACHSPGRINRAPKKRSCTLSCQGCHVNPNGGGMRNAYGKWNSQRFLKSYQLKSWLHGKKAPAPRSSQAYAGKYHKSVRPKKFSKKASKRFRKKGRSPLATLRKMKFSDKPYNKYADQGWKYNAKSDAEFESFLTSSDPYFIERNKNVTTNADVRFLSLFNSGDEGGYQENSGYGVMSLDFGMRFKPFRNRKISLVFENRYLNSPYNTEWNAVFKNSSVRSAYMLYDKMPYNSYFMAGVYNPMFGNQGSNHRSLRDTIAFGYEKPGKNPIYRFGGAANVKYEGVSFGTSPNVPFLNVHYLTDSGISGVTDKSTGFVINAGARFVTLGASIVGSYWSTKKEQAAGEELSKNMFALTLGGKFKRLITNFEFLGFDEEFEREAANSGSVMTLEMKYRLFKESYLTGVYAVSNTSRTQDKGSASDISIGYKIFILSGFELDFAYWMHSNIDESEVTAVNLDWNSFQIQTHMYF